MAGWQDGAEYAPTERPDGFAMPVVDPIETISPTVTDTPGPILPPQGFVAETGLTPLNQVTPQMIASRDPNQPFETTSAAIASDSAWGSAHRVGEPTLAANFDPRLPMGLPPGNLTQMPIGAFPPPEQPYGGFPPLGQQPESFIGYPMSQPSPYKSGWLHTKPQRQTMLAASIIFGMGAVFPPTAPLAILIGAGLFARVDRRVAVTLLLMALVPIYTYLTKAPDNNSSSMISFFCALFVFIGLVGTFSRGNGQNRNG